MTLKKYKDYIIRVVGTGHYIYRPTEFSRNNFGDARTMSIESAKQWIDKEERIKHLESIGQLDPNCPECKEVYKSETGLVFAPSHKASIRCQSGHRNHCTCDTCF